MTRTPRPLSVRLESLEDRLTPAVGDQQFVIGNFPRSSTDFSIELGASGISTGDVNGDGLTDVMTSAFAENAGTGFTAVVFGRSDRPSPLGNSGAQVDAAGGLDGHNGFRLAYPYGGVIVGDVNGDGLADIAVETIQTTPVTGGPTTVTTDLHIVFGRRGGFPAVVDPTALGPGEGVTIRQVRADSGNNLGGGVVAVGDVNGDGLADVYFGPGNSDPPPGQEPPGFTPSPDGYILFGGTGLSASSTFNGTIGLPGIPVYSDRIPSSSDTPRFSGAPTPLGDLNGDGRADLAFGGGTLGTGIWYGAAGGTIRVADPGTFPTVLHVTRGQEELYPVSLATGDVNGDGRPDLIVGVPDSDYVTPYAATGLEDTGAVFVAYNGPGGYPADLDVTQLPPGAGLRIDGTRTADDLGAPSNTGGEEAGYSVAAADLNGDGYADVVLGAPHSANVNLDGLSGRATDARVGVVFGGPNLTGDLPLSSLDGRNGVTIDGGDPSAFGYKMAAVRDFNGDGVADVVVAAPIARSGQDVPHDFQGQVYVVYGSRGAGRSGPPQFAVGAGAGGQLRIFNPDGSVQTDLAPFPNFTGGVRTAVADFNGDGVADVVAGTGPGTEASVRVLDGKDGHELFSTTPFPGFTGGVFVAAGDLTGDGVPDFVITPDEGGGPRVRVLNGKDFSPVADFFGINDPNFRGGARAALGDVDGDGKADLIVAAGFGGGPRVAVFSGAKVAAQGTQGGLTADAVETWKLVGDFIAFDPALRNGVYVAAGDLDGDGKADLVFGAGPGGGPEVRIVSGAKFLGAGGPSLTTSAADPARLADFFAGDVNNRGGLRVAAKDLDGDGRADLIVGPGDGGGSHVTGYPAKTLAADGGPTSVSFDAFPGVTNGVFVG